MLSTDGDFTILLFESIYEQYFGKVYGFVRKNVEDTGEVEDLTHDVFLKLWQSRASFSRVVPVDAQLLVIARQLIINAHRRNVIKNRVLEQWHSAHPTFTHADSAALPIHAEELSQELMSAIESLPPRRREIFEKSRFEGLSYDQIADEMAISRNTVEVQMVKALSFLRRRLSHFAFISLILTFS